MSSAEHEAARERLEGMAASWERSAADREDWHEALPEDVREDMHADAAAIRAILSELDRRRAPQPVGECDPVNNTADDLLRRGDVVKLLAERAAEHAELALSGESEQARLREAMEAAFSRARYAVAFMPAALAPQPVGEREAREAFLDLISDAKEWHEEGDEDGFEYTLRTTHHSLLPLMKAFGIEPVSFTEIVDGFAFPVTETPAQAIYRVANEAPAALASPGEGERLDAELVEAARAVIAQWDTPNWKLNEPTADIINRLRVALSASPAFPSVGGWRDIAEDAAKSLEWVLASSTGKVWFQAAWDEDDGWVTFNRYYESDPRMPDRKWSPKLFVALPAPHRDADGLEGEGE